MTVNLHFAFVLFVVLGFALHFASTLPAHPWTIRLAWASWLIAALLWALSSST